MTKRERGVVGEQINTNNKNTYKIENTTYMYHSATEKQRDKWTRPTTIFIHYVINRQSIQCTSGIITVDKSSIIIH